MLAKALSAATAAAAEKLYVEDVFSTWLYTGNGSTQTITNGIDLAGEGGLVWFKQRNSAGTNNVLIDTARGRERWISSNTTNGNSGAISAGYELTSFNSDGFSLGLDLNAYLNTSAATYTSWTFRKAAKFFDVVTYTGTGSARTVAHNLGSVPGCIVVKRTDSADGWHVWHRSLANNEYLLLNTTGAKSTSTTIWNNTAPTSSVFSLGTDAGGNANGGTYVAYLFAHDAGGFGDSGNESVIKCGSYTGNGSTTGPIVNLGWEPQWLMIKRADSTSDWNIFDNMRGMTVGGDEQWLSANLDNAESAANSLSPLATGFQLTAAGTGVNASGGTYIYIVIRRGPMKTPTDATKVFSANTWTGTGTTQQITTGFFPDACLAISRNKQATTSNWLFDNLRGVNKQSYTNDVVAEGADTGKAFTMTGLSNNSGNLNSTTGSATYVGEFFRRAPGFFDVVAYTGTGSATTVSHNLGVAPELMIVKSRSTAEAGGWVTYSAALGGGKYLTLNSTDAEASSINTWNNTAPTSSVFSLGTLVANNRSAATYIAYLFATVSGVSKVGSYTGTGTTQQINCGFTAGSRLVLIKRTDSTGDWYIYDTARGIVSGNDSYLLLNSTAAEVTSTDYIDPLSSGFEISSTAPAAINANGGSFIFLAIA